MSYRWHARAEVDPDNPRAWAVCSRCGFLTNHHKLAWQHQWSGNALINLRLLVCEDCLDRPAEFLRTVILPPDPKPIFNAQPEPYSIDETDFRITEEGDQRITEAGEPRITEDNP